ncbi:hypothetical protein Mterra_02711 [Calidithermus terrae]|uniref:Uncharacterized protein n=1 Tax=Calidithermus terrae TaxID=1408545 RepID=A0A399EGV7_9DEIN|nr:hypothetical protein Mterra_02711 [Calidithermus terrae]
MNMKVVLRAFSKFRYARYDSMSFGNLTVAANPLEENPNP